MVDQSEKFKRDYSQYGFVTDIGSEQIPAGLNEETVARISEKKNEPQWMLDWRLKAFAHWKKMKMPQWPELKIPTIDFNRWFITRLLSKRKS